MREIKFRAWNKEEKKMEYPDYNDQGFAFYNDGGFRINGGFRYPEVNTYDVMQYTGLKDKNGKEIYEGDILGWNYYCQDKKIIRTSIVEWDNDNSCFEFNDYNRPNFLERKVIGNIYENPELIKNI